MDDLARAAGLSRQGLYLHFKAKDELFRAAVLHRVETTAAACRAALSNPDRNTHERVLGAFEAFHGPRVGPSGEPRVGTLLAIEPSLLAGVAEEHERRFVDAVAHVLACSGESRDPIRGEPGPRQRAETLVATSLGLTHQVTTTADYRRRMDVALRIVLADIASPEPAGRRAVSNFPT